MSNGMSEEQIRALAKKRVEAKRGFLVHFAIYIAVNTGLVVIWLFATGRGFPWFIFPIFGWGIGALFHYLGAYHAKGASGGPGSAAIEKEAEKIRKG